MFQLISIMTVGISQRNRDSTGTSTGRGFTASNEDGCAYSSHEDDTEAVQASVVHQSHLQGFDLLLMLLVLPPMHSS